MFTEFVDEEGIRWTLEKCRPGVALLNYYNISWKPKNNHFNRYTDVKAKGNCYTNYSLLHTAVSVTSFIVVFQNESMK